jgi:hypothetical protein
LSTILECQPKTIENVRANDDGLIAGRPKCNAGIKICIQRKLRISTIAN